jgi:transposase-like protein
MCDEEQAARLERLYLEFRRRSHTQGSLPGEAAVLALLYELLGSGQIRFRKLDGWQDMAVALTAPLAQTGRAA